MASSICAASSRVGARISARVPGGTGPCSAAVSKPLEDRHDERGGFARAGLGRGDHVVAGKGVGQHGALDRPRLFEPELADAAGEKRIESER